MDQVDALFARVCLDAQPCTVAPLLHTHALVSPQCVTAGRFHRCARILRDVNRYELVLC